MEKISYNKLNSRQKENYNFLKVSSILAEYGFYTLRLSDDWQGADFIANHIDGQTFLKVQLKGRFTLEKKYIGKDIWICFPYKDDWYLYSHDKIVDSLSQCSNYQNTLSWKEKGKTSSGTLSVKDRKLLNEFKL